MPVSIVPMAPTCTHVVIYDGTNGSEIEAAVLGLTLVSDTGSEMTWEDGGSNTHVTAVGDGVRLAGAVDEGFTAEGNVTAAEMAVCNRPLQVAFAAPVVPTLAVGSAPVPSLLLGASTTVSVDLHSDMPSTNYQVDAAITGAVGSLAITGLSIVDEATVQVTVHAGVAYVSGAQVLVVALGV